MRTFLTIDTETTGLKDTDVVTEVGYALYDIEDKRLVMSGGQYVKLPTGVTLSKEIQELTKIKPEYLEQFGVEPSVACGWLRDIETATNPEAIVAHNAFFDKSFMARLGWTTTRPWICTQNDLPGNVGQSKLRYVALELGTLNFYPKHRAQFDSILCGDILLAFDFDEVLVRAKSPTVILIADVTFKENQRAKDAGFKWERPIRHSEKKVPKNWVLATKELDLQDLRRKCGELGFTTSVFQGTLS
jgi:DNA polymerase-3 subunit epsilon